MISFKAIAAIALTALGVGLPLWGHALIDAEPRQSYEGEAASGKFLIAAESIADSRFRESVILLLNHDENGTVGVIVNRPTRIPLTEFLSESIHDSQARTLYFGGPVRPMIFSMLVKSGQSDSGKSYILDQTYFVFGTNEVMDLAKLLDPSAAVRIYAGYAGWAPGQLDFEIRQGSWHLAPGDPAVVFAADPALIWRQLIQQVSGRWL